MIATATNPGGSLDVDGSFRSVDASQLRVSTRLRMPIYDERDVLLLAADHVITPMFMQRLRNRDVSSVKVHESELDRVYACQPLGTATAVPDDRRGHHCALKSETSEHLDKAIREGGKLGLPQQGDAFADEIQSHGVTAYDDDTREEFIQTHHQSVDQVSQVFEALSSGRGLDMDSLTAIADEALAELSTDADLFACLGINPFPNKYPARHSMHTAMLAMSIGTKLKLDRKTLKELAIGCLIHDSGMLRINSRVYRTRSVIDPVSFLEVTKHPILVFDMVKEMQQIPSRSAFIAYQIHERCNGTGYPRRREANQIHFLSKVAAVADVFIGLVSPRPHRAGMLPCRAMERILHGTRNGLFDGTAVRALLNTVSLFPIGSYVELSDGRLGRVIRANGDAYDKPMVETWDAGALDLQPRILDLAEREGLHVVRPLARLDSTADATAFGDHWD